MSAPETLEMARSVMNALGGRDLPVLLERSDREVEWHSFFAQLGKEGVYRGHDGTRDYVRDLDEAWDLVRADIDDAIAVGHVAVLVGRIRYRGKSSGIESENPAGWMLRFRDGKLTCFRAFRDPEEALAEVGRKAK